MRKVRKKLPGMLPLSASSFSPKDMPGWIEYMVLPKTGRRQTHEVYIPYFSKAAPCVVL